MPSHIELGIEESENRMRRRAGQRTSPEIQKTVNCSYEMTEDKRDNTGPQQATLWWCGPSLHTCIYTARTISTYAPHVRAAKFIRQTVHLAKSNSILPEFGAVKLYQTVHLSEFNPFKLDQQTQFDKVKLFKLSIRENLAISNLILPPIGTVQCSRTVSNCPSE